VKLPRQVTRSPVKHLFTCLNCMTVSVWFQTCNLSSAQRGWHNYKQLLDKVFVISRIIKVKVSRVISRSWTPRLITLTETLTILDVTKTEYNNCFIIHWTKQEKNSCLCFFTDSKQNEASELGMITPTNHASRTYMTWLPVTLTWLLYNLLLWCHRHWFWKFTVHFRPMIFYCKLLWM